MQTTSLFEKGAIQFKALGIIAPAATVANSIFLLGTHQRNLLFVMGQGPAPVGTVTVAIKSKVGGAAAVALPTDTLLWTAATIVPNTGLTNNSRAVVKALAGGKYVIPQAVTVGDATNHLFTHALLLDVPVLPDGTDQIAVDVTNDGSVGSSINLLWIGEHPRY